MWWTQPGSVGVRRRVGRALLVGEDRDQPAVARIEVEMALGGVVEVRLLEHERHPEHALPEVDRRLAVGADERDVVDALALELPHRLSICSTSFGLVLAALQLPHGTSSTSRLDDERGREARRGSPRARPASAVAPARQLDR